MVARLLLALLVVPSVVSGAPTHTLSKITIDGSSPPRCFDITSLHGGHGLTSVGNGRFYAGLYDQMWSIKIPKSGNTPILDQLYADGTFRTWHFGVAWMGRYGTFDWKGMHIGTLLNLDGSFPDSGDRAIWVRGDVDTQFMQYGAKLSELGELYLTWDGKYFYTGWAENADSQVFIRKLRVDQNNVWIVNEFELPIKRRSWAGLDYDGKFLWAASWEDSSLYRVTPDGKNLDAKLYTSCVGKFGRGLAWDGKYLWIRESDEDPEEGEV